MMITPVQTRFYLALRNQACIPKSASVVENRGHTDAAKHGAK
jgi:hypothetical protein